MNALRKNNINSVELDLQKLRGIETDNARVMIGVNNDVYNKLKA